VENNPMSKKIYICGAMSGVPDFNYPAFNMAAVRLRELGHVVENPAENAEPQCGTWSGWLRAAISQVIKCDTIAVLPDSENSKGAILEQHIARELGILIVPISELITDVKAPNKNP
jgi:hypothetical protein